MRITYFVNSSKDVFSEPLQLAEITEEEYSIVRRNTNEDKFQQVKYELYHGDRLLSLIKGYVKTKGSFHITRIENVTRKQFYKVPGSKTLPYILNEMEIDLYNHFEIRKLTSSSLAWIAPKVIERYGFREETGKTAKQLKGSVLKYIPWKAVGLEKQIWD